MVVAVEVEIAVETAWPTSPACAFGDWRASVALEAVSIAQVLRQQADLLASAEVADSVVHSVEIATALAGEIELANEVSVAVVEVEPVLAAADSGVVVAARIGLAATEQVASAGIAFAS